MSSLSCFLCVHCCDVVLRFSAPNMIFHHMFAQHQFLCSPNTLTIDIGTKCTGIQCMLQHAEILPMLIQRNYQHTHFYRGHFLFLFAAFICLVLHFFNICYYTNTGAQHTVIARMMCVINDSFKFMPLNIHIFDYINMESCYYLQSPPKIYTQIQSQVFADTNIKFHSTYFSLPRRYSSERTRTKNLTFFIKLLGHTTNSVLLLHKRDCSGLVHGTSFIAFYTSNRY